MKTRTTLTIKGKVQKVGFRTFVEERAKETGITGYVLNRRDGSVLVVCEGEETKISELIGVIEKSSFDIEDIQKTHGKPTGEFKTFERTGEDVPKDDTTLGDVVKVLKLFDDKAEQLVQLQRETKEELGSKIDGLGLGGKIDGLGGKIDGLGGKIDGLGNDLGGKIDGLGGKIDGLGGKIDGLGNDLGGKIDGLGGKIDGLGGKIDDFHRDTVDQFNLLDVKYGIIAEMIGKAVEGMEKNNKSTNELLIDAGINAEKNVGKILSRMEEQQENHNQIIEKLIKAIIETKK